MTDPMRLRQMLTNLVSNADQVHRGRVESAVRADYAPASAEGVLRVEVEDTGIGIAADTRQVFEQFVQIDNSLTRRAGGTGLGLAITKQLVELMGGDIGVTSTPGDGQHLRLHRSAPGPAPRRRPPAGGRGAGAGRGGAAAAARPAGRGQRHQPVSDQRLPARGRARRW